MTQTTRVIKQPMTSVRQVDIYQLTSTSRHQIVCHSDIIWEVSTEICRQPMTSVQAHIYQLTSTSRHQTVCVCHRVINWNLQMTNYKCAGSHQLVDINQQTPNSLSSERCHQLKSATNISDIIWEVSTEICNQPMHWLQWHLCRFTSTSCVQRPFCRHQTVCHRVTSYNDFPHDSFFNHSSSFFSSNASSPPTLVVFQCTFQKRERCWSS